MKSLPKNTGFPPFPKTPLKQWLTSNSNPTIPQPTHQLKDLRQAQCSQLSTSNSTVESAVYTMTEREILLKKISTYQFAILDLQIFLNTHPNDQKTLEKVNEYKKALTPLTEEYEKKYGMLTKRQSANGNWHRWIKNPWPWDNEEDD